ncbi:MAG: transporter [Candidatus Marinimicrobia bacterium]|nr:transporter [Candidatus Neomarinimicrobiota bacterium]MCF7827433.1 transporter [Candidatus Neomarinimicrobiota bacterium]MCF7881334.1 transporter [Candidatus Neomarinimicrobiota bacterium]
MPDFITSTYFLLAVVIALGIILGNFRYKGISLDNSGVLFIALLAGHLGFIIPTDFQDIGLVLFIFTIGIQAGPGFFESFKRQGQSLILSTVTLVLTATVVTVIVALLFRVDFNLAVGLLTGALTSTPGLAAAIEGTNSPLASIGYGVAYPFGVIGVILFVRLIPKIFRADLERERDAYQEAEQEDYPELRGQNFIVENQNISGKTLRELKVYKMTGANISRVQRGEKASSPTPETTLETGDLIRAVGTEEALHRLELLVGHQTDEEIPLSQDYDFQWVLVTNKNVANKKIGELNLLERYNTTVTRIRRGGLEITPQPHRQIRYGDRLMIISTKDNLSRAIEILGNEERQLSKTDFLPIALGIVIGVLIGQVPIPLFGLTTIHLGLTGGVLATALILSRIGKTGPIIWSMSWPANNLLRQLGLLFFLASVGTHAGAEIAGTFTQYGPKLFLIGAIITIIPMIVMTLVAYFAFGMNFLVLLGVLTGSMTSTPGLAAVDSLTESNAPQVSYATVYPIALVCIIIIAQVLGAL